MRYVDDNPGLASNRPGKSYARQTCAGPVTAPSGFRSNSLRFTPPRFASNRTEANISRMEKSGEAREENGKSKTEKLIETDLSKKQKTETRSTSQPREQTKVPFPIMFKSIRPDHFTLFPFSNSRGYPSFSFEPDSRSMREIALFTIPSSFQLSWLSRRSRLRFPFAEQSAHERKAPENPSDVNATCCRLSEVMYSTAPAPTCARTSPQDAT